MTKRTNEQRDAAYERGWVDSLTGWARCADYRWQDRSNRGVAPDPTYREPRI